MEHRALDGWTPVQQRITREIKIEKFITHRSWRKDPMISRVQQGGREVKSECRKREIGPGARASIRVYEWSALEFLGEGQSNQCKGKSSLLVYSSGILSKGHTRGRPYERQGRLLNKSCWGVISGAYHHLWLTRLPSRTCTCIWGWCSSKSL